jgi:multimeric flavodoxin WrbA
MKVLAINGSPHANGTTGTALTLLSETLIQHDIEAEIVHIGHEAIHGCTACGHCGKAGVHGCVFTDDPVNACIEKMREADGLLLGCPVYYGGVAGAMKCFLDRFFYAGAHARYKVGAGFVCLRRSGGIEAFHQLNNYLTLGQMVIVPTQYWNVVHGNGKELLQDGEGVQILQNLGRNMAWLMRSLEESGKRVPPPAQVARVRTNFVR